MILGPDGRPVPRERRALGFTDRTLPERDGDGQLGWAVSALIVSPRQTAWDGAGEKWYRELTAGQLAPPLAEASLAPPRWSRA